MTFRKTALLALVFALLCGAYWATQFVELRGERANIQARRLFDFPPDAVHGLTIQPIDLPAVAAERDQADAPWRITAPNPEIPAYAALWERLARVAANLESERTLDAKAAGLAEYGLDEPRLVVHVRAAERKAQSIAFGIMEPLQISRYARVDDGPVILIKNDAFLEVNRTLDELRDAFVFTAVEPGITRIEFARIWTGRGAPAMEHPPAVGEESVRVVAERGVDSGLWRLREPIDAAADQEAVAKLVQEIQFARGRDFIDAPAPLADYGLEPPFARLTVQCGPAGEPQTLLVGSADLSGEHDNGLFVKRADRPGVFLIDPHVLTLLPLTPHAWRDKRLFTRTKGRINALDYATPAATLRLAVDKARGWVFAPPHTGDADTFIISDFVAKLIQLEAKDFAEGDRAAFGLDPAALTVTLHFEDGDAPLVIHVGGETPDGKHRYATQDTGDIVMIDVEAAAALLGKTYDDFRSLDLLRFDKTLAVLIELEYDGAHCVIEKLDGRWQVAEPAGAKLQNQSDAERILDAASPLRATAALREPAPPGALDQPVLNLTITTRDPAAPAAETRHGPVSVGAPAQGSAAERYAAAAGREGAYLVSQDLLDVVRASLEGLRDVPSKM